MSRVHVGTPFLSVVLKKTVARDQSAKAERYTSGAKEVDFDKFLSDESSVSVTRTINAPAGSFAITVADAGYKYGDDIDSLYGIVEPMDILEIRMCQNQQEYNGIPFPLVMRCVVSEVRRDEAIGSDGKPKRTVAITGQDWGKFLQINQIKYIKGNPDGKDWLSAAVMAVRFGIERSIMTAGEVITTLIDKVANPFIRRYDDTDIVPFLVDTSGADANDKVMPQGFQAFPGGTLWEYFQVFGDLGPFYELFIDDTENGPKIIYRKPLFFDLDGQIYAGSMDSTVNVPPDHIIRLSVSRTDADVANWFWIDHARVNLVSDQALKLMAMGDNPYGSNKPYANNDSKLYGTRTLEVKSQHGPTITQAAPKEQVLAESASFIDYNTAKIEKLRKANQDNVLLESGTMMVKGNEKIKVGSYIYVVRGNFHARYYVKSVTHTFNPFRSFTTTVQFIRGTGFVNRSSSGQIGQNPYLQEIGRSPYES